MPNVSHLVASTISELNSYGAKVRKIVDETRQAYNEELKLSSDQRLKLSQDVEGLLLLDSGRRGNTPPMLQLEALSNRELQDLFWLLIRAIPPLKK